MRVIVMGPLKISSQVGAWQGLSCPRSVLRCLPSTPQPWGGSESVCLTASLLLFLSFPLFPFSPGSFLPILSAQDGALHCSHWQEDVQAPL